MQACTCVVFKSHASLYLCDYIPLERATPVSSRGGFCNVRLPLREHRGEFFESLGFENGKEKIQMCQKQQEWTEAPWCSWYCMTFDLLMFGEEAGVFLRKSWGRHRSWLLLSWTKTVFYRMSTSLSCECIFKCIFMYRVQWCGSGLYNCTRKELQRRVLILWLAPVRSWARWVVFLNVNCNFFFLKYR